MTGALVLERYRRIHPDASVLVLDRSTAAAGATGRSAGVCVPLGGVPGRTPLVGPGQAYFAGAARWREAGLVRPLEVWFVLRRHNVPGFLDAWQGGPLRPVAAERVATVRERAGDLRVDPDEEVLASSGDCYAVDAARLTRALLDLHLSGPGSALWEGCEVVAISPEPGAVRVVLASGHAVHARSVAVAAGGWCPVWPGAAPAQPVKRIAALTVDHPGAGLPMLDFIDDELFILPGDAGLTVSFRRESFAVPGAPLDPTVTAADLDEGRRALTRRSPALAAAVVGAHVGHDAYPHDGAPMVTVTAAGRVVDARGMGGSGIRLGPAVADRVVAALTTAIPPPAPPATEAAGTEAAGVGAGGRDVR
ncbi:FAD-dependent oxidoreductase [Dactylosporangium sp. NPDC049742]|uniref:NAD(P)/FAD-dependent oxidoreductase n=1 Tax=Dactylosporangium sp. NPDC049742 TaxID=3154737 RepID=UPI00341A3E7A